MLRRVRTLTLTEACCASAISCRGCRLQFQVASERRAGVIPIIAMPSTRAKRARECEDDTKDNGRSHHHKQRSESITLQLSPSSPPAPSSSADAHSERLQTVFDWAIKHGASAPKLRLNRGEYGWGVFAAADIAPAEEIASIPLTLVLTHQKAEDGPVGAAVRELNDRLQSSATLPHPAVPISPRTTLYLYMIEQLVRPAAFFHPYLASLSPPCSPLLWPPSSLFSLSGTNLHAAIPHKLRQLRARYDNCVPLLCDCFPATFDAQLFTFERFLWAHTQLTSRGFPVRVGERSAEERVTAGELRAEGSKRPNERVGCLLPLLDMTNHRMRTPITWTTTSSDNARVSFRTGSSVSAGSEVFNNYGAKSNEEFLLGYGFCVDDNPYDEYTVQLGGVDGETAYMLNQLRLPWRDKGYYLTADSTPQPLLGVLRVAVMTEAEREVWGWQLVEQGLAADVGYVGMRNEVAMLDQLQHLLMSRLTKLGHDSVQQAEIAEQQDRERLAQADMAEDERLALLYKKGQRNILIARIKHTLQTNADILARTPPLPSYRLSLPVVEADQQHMQQLATAWERAINPVAPPSSVAVSISSSLLITPSSIRQSETFAPVLDYAAGLTVHQELTLFVLHQLQLGSASPYAPLLSLLQHSAHPSRLLPRLFESSVEYSDALDVYEQLFPALSEADPALLSASIHSRDNWLWAHYIVHRHTVLLPTADGALQPNFLPVTSMPPSDQVCRGRVQCDEQRLTITCDEGAVDARVVYVADAEDDGRSIWTRGEYVAGSHPIIRIAASALFPASLLATLSSTHQALFALFQSWDDEQAETGHFYVGESGVSGGLLAWCRLLAMTAEEIAVLMQQQSSSMDQNQPSTTIGSAVVLDTDERVDEEEGVTVVQSAPDDEHDEQAAEGHQADVDDELRAEEDEEGVEEEEQMAQERAAVPRRSMRRLLLAGPTELPHLLDWHRIRTSGWQQLRSALQAYVDVEAAKLPRPDISDERTVAGVAEVSWERLREVHQLDRLRVLRAWLLMPSPPSHSPR